MEKGDLGERGDGPESSRFSSLGRWCKNGKFYVVKDGPQTRKKICSEGDTSLGAPGMVSGKKETQKETPRRGSGVLGNQKRKKTRKGNKKPPPKKHQKPKKKKKKTKNPKCAIRKTSEDGAPTE